MNQAVVISKHLDEPPPRPGDVRPELTYFDTPFAHALKKNPTERFRHCRDFAKALDSKEGLGPYSPSAGAAAFLTVPQTNGAGPTEPAVSPPLAAAVPAAPAAEVVDAVAPPDVLPEADVGDAAVTPADVLPATEVDDAITLEEPDVRSAATDDRRDTRMAARRRRRLQTARLGLAILTVAAGGIFGVMALRSASESRDAPTDLDTPSSVTSVPRARPAPATAPLPPPVVIAPAPVTTTPPLATPSLAATTAAPTISSSPPHTTLSQTTSPRSPPTTTSTTPGGLDTRPAVGMPCGPQGTAATSNSGNPVICVDTPGGSAWEPPGG
ncbi:MAG: hypothetical protein JOY55_17580 [Mycobacterium sp.]|nr:hypothetical protein [Mycobacterium sp.]